ncbi:IS701 family transposase [Streptomyces sp. ACA25]|uniref:IS701 family transposase n=1 Tax=Streptomyces sp. ACA25 TaxID=3022596 RepID=UPI003FA7B379
MRPMPEVRRKGEPGEPDLASVSEACAALLASLPRVDQRRKGELYVHGLLTAPGRKTMRNLAALTDERAAEQSLHHFISCSTWDWTAVRATLARLLDRVLSPRAWVVRSMVVPKTGRHSVGVERRFVPALGETVNSQHSYGLWLVSEAAAVPVNWQLSIGKGRPQANRGPERAAVEDAPTGDSAAVQAVQAVQAVLKASAWGIEPRPVVMDARDSALSPLVEAFSAAGLPFLLRISGGSTLLAPELSRGENRVAAASAEHLLGRARSQRRPVEWIDPASPGARHTSLMAPLQVIWPGLHDPLPPRPYALAAPGAPSRTAPGGLPLTLLGKWKAHERDVQEVWLTNMTDAGYGPLLRLSKLTRRVNADFARVSTEVGIQDFEGRSYQGWHRHITLVCVAHALRLLGTGELRAGWTEPAATAAYRAGDRRGPVAVTHGPAGGAGRAVPPGLGPVAAIPGRAAG